MTAMDEKQIRQLLGPPNKIVRLKDRQRGRSWLCSTCGAVTVSVEPIPIPAPCKECGGRFFEMFDELSH
jgi:hypothetical protein